MIPENWDDVANFCDSKIYHLRAWGDLINKVHGYKLVYLQEENGVFPLAFVKSAIFGSRLISLPFADYGGFCAKDEAASRSLIEQAERAAQELKVDFLEVRTPAASKDFTIFQEKGFVRRDDYSTFILDLTKSPDQLWQEIGPKNRNMVRLAQKNGVEVTEVKTRDDLKIFYNLYLATMKRLGSPPQAFKFFTAIFEIFSEKNRRVLLVRQGNKCLAGGLFFFYKNTIHHSYGCSLATAALGANNLILWSVIKNGQAQGFKTLDLGRTRENAGNVLFKKRWGGSMVKMPYFYKFYKKELKQRQEIKYQKLAGLWRDFLPKFIADKIGPWLIKQIG